jgi:predicted component of type VI protein secretion system
MAKRNDALYRRLRDSGLRKSAATRITQAVSSGSGRGQKVIGGAVQDLRGLVTELEDRAKGGPAKRKAAAQKAANTRKRKAAKRSQAAKKGARTRARS